MKKLMKLAMMSLAIAAMIGTTGCGKKDTTGSSESKTESVKKFSTPEAVVKEAFARTQKGDFKGVAELVANEKMKKQMLEMDAEIQKMDESIKKKVLEEKTGELEIVETKIDGDKATVEFTVKASDGKVHKQTAELVKVDGSWKIEK